jgi:hypothetical protein
MNLDAIKKKLESMNKSTSSGGNSNNQVKRFKPSIGKQTSTWSILCAFKIKSIESIGPRSL